VVYQRETLIEGVPNDRIACSGGVCMFRGNGTGGYLRESVRLSESTTGNEDNVLLHGQCHA
jgi:hypothetical protein